MNLGEAYLDHYERFLGHQDPHTYRRWGHEGGSVQVLSYPEAMVDTTILATLGLTHYQELLRDVVEVVIPTSVLDDVVLDAVTASLSFLLHLKTPIEGVSYLRHLHRSVPEFFDRYGKSALALTAPYPFPDEFAHVRLQPSGRSGKVWMGFFLAEAEVQFIEREGVEALYTLFEAQGVDVIDLARPSVVSPG